VGLAVLFALALQGAQPADIPPDLARVLAENPEVGLDDPANPPGTPVERACSEAPRPENKVRACTRALRNNRNAHHRAQLLDTRGHAYDDLGQMERAIADYGAAMRLWPEYGGPYIDRANLRMEAGDYRGAITDYDDLIRVIPGATAFDLRCWARAMAGLELDQALADCERAIKMQPDDATPHIDRAVIWLRRGEASRALEDINFSLGQSPGEPTALYIRGLAKSALGDVKGAEADIAAANAAHKPDVDFLIKWGLTPEMTKAAVAKAAAR
jgi:tetratricopeptide (TPR) repeat protein